MPAPAPLRPRRPARGTCAVLLAALLALPAGGCTRGGSAAAAAPQQAFVLVPKGAFTMGHEGGEARYDERPAHRVHVDQFRIGATEVTNAQFAAFVAATGHVTTAERPIAWDELERHLPPGTPRPPGADLAPGSLVFTPPDRAVGTADHSQWWTWTPGACWRHPRGPGSSIEGLDEHPVVHVSWHDAVAYAQWAGGELPTEAQWERAARYGHDGAPFAWGDELLPQQRHMANVWQGAFPHDDTGDDGFTGTAPVGSFPPSGLGLYDMAGNVWEWTRDRFRPDAYRQRLASLPPGGCCSNPAGPTSAADPRNPYADDSRVQKGGSFLCHASYCSSYRPSAKMAAPPDSSMSHLGFRIVLPPQPTSSDRFRPSPRER